MTGVAGDGRLGIVDMLSGYRTSCPGRRARERKEVGLKECVGEGKDLYQCI
jgi:hypothetical protein